MLNIFKHRISGKAALTPIWNAVNNLIARYLRRLADVLSRKSERLSRNHKWFLLAIFIICFGTACICIICIAMGKKSGPLSVDRLAIPAYVVPRPSFPAKGPSTDFTVEELRHLQALARYVDSLRENNSPAYDSIIASNPGFGKNLAELKDILKTYKIK
jgi:hypothetical protein